MKVDRDSLIVRQAINSCLLLEICYDSVKTRVVQPHSLVKSKATGVEYLMALQIGGYTRTKYGWKFFIIKNIYGSTLLDENFVPLNYSVPAWATEIQYQ